MHENEYHTMQIHLTHILYISRGIRSKCPATFLKEFTL